VIERYSPPEMVAVFADTARFARYLEIEVLVVEAWEELGVAPAGSAAACRARAPKIDDAFVAAVAERELITNHDVAAFVDVVQNAIGGPEAAWIHYGLTSTDVVDTAWCSLMNEAAGLLDQAATDLLAVLVRMAETHCNSVMIGRTHGIHAEPTTFGTYSNIDPSIEAFVCARLGLTPTPATQVVARDRHAAYLYACATIGTTVELIAVNLRHLQRTEVSEVQEGFRPGQKGSSAMPHKRNPISAETLTGLSRVLRGNMLAGFENVALWHERDISHSSVERVVVPDSSTLTYYVLKRLKNLLTGLQVDTARMRENIASSYNVVFSQPVLLALISSGFTRDEAYRIVQENAAKAWADRTDFRMLMEADPRASALSKGSLDDAFDLDRAVLGASRTVAAVRDLC
jgi:adenylosuccinate lyase